MTDIVTIPIANIRILNPRFRNKRRFAEIVESIEKAGLKVPITVAEREGEPGFYDLVCGQGRIEACQALGDTEVPALVREVSKLDCYIMSILENVAKRRIASLDMAREVAAQRDNGCTAAESAERLAISESYVSMILRLVDRGEERLLRAVESGEIPINVAIEIAASDDAAIQRSLAEAYTSKQLRGKQLIAARRLVDERRTRGKGLKSSGARPKSNLTADELVKTYRKEALRQKRFVRKAQLVESSLVFVAGALKQLVADENFVNLLRAEKLEGMPEYLATAVRGAA